MTGAPLASAVSGRSVIPSVIAMAQPPAVAILAAMIFVFMPPFEMPETGSPAMASIAGVILPTVSKRRAVGSSLGFAE